MAFDFPTDRANLNPAKPAGALQNGDTTIISDILYTFVIDGTDSWWTANVATSPDDRYVNVGGDTMTGDLVVEGDVQVESLNGGPLAGFRNLIINGGMDIAQRGVSGTNSGYVTADRWSFGSNVASAITTIGKVADSVGATHVLQVTSAAVVISQAVELPLVNGLPVSQLITGQQYTVSLLAADAVDSVSVNLRYADGHTGGNLVDVATDAGFVAMTETDFAGGFKRFSRTFTVSNNAPGNTNRCILVSFNFLAAGGTIQFTNVQLEQGPVATPFERRPIGTELALCQRYFEIKPINVRFSNTTGSNSTHTNTVTTFSWSVEKRIAPTLTATNVTEEGGAAVGGPGFYPAGTGGFGAGVVIGPAVSMHVAADVAGDAEV